RSALLLALGARRSFLWVYFAMVFPCLFALSVRRIPGCLLSRLLLFLLVTFPPVLSLFGVCVRLSFPCLSCFLLLAFVCRVASMQLPPRPGTPLTRSTTKSAVGWRDLIVLEVGLHSLCLSLFICLSVNP